MLRKIFLVLPFVALMGVAGCESKEDRAERYYQSALALMAEGDVDRALIELRNVFDNNGFHKEARQLYADTVLERGDVAEAYGQYLRLVEQYPDLLDVRLTLAEMAATNGDWDEVERHGQAAIGLAPDNPRVAAIAAAIAYRRASMDNDADAKAAAAAAAQNALDAEPDSRIARSVVIDALLTSETPLDALEPIDAALALEPASLDLQMLKFRLLAQFSAETDAEAQLERISALFPDNEEVRRALIGWYMARENFDGAERLLREMAGPLDGEVGGHLTLVQFLSQARGPEAAATELDQLIAATDGTDKAELYRALQAGLTFEGGAREAAITQMQAIVAGAEPSDQTRQIKIMLARMLIATGNPVGARALVEEVLTDDASNVDALKLRAAWAIQDDNPGAAINDLRTALSQAPRDAEIMTLMAEAHVRDGATELAGERLSLAVEVSGNAPAESLRYVDFLMSQNRDIAARAVLADARRVSPGNLDLITASAQVAMQQEDWATLDGLVVQLEAITTPEAAQLVSGLRAARLMGQGRVEETLALLEEQIAAGGAEGSRATALLVMTRFRAGDADGARAALDAALAATPDDPDLRLMSANLHLGMNEAEAAEAELRGMLEVVPGNEAAVSRLHGLLTVLGRGGEATEVLQAGLEAAPDSVLLRVMTAGEMEVAGDIDGAIAIYEALYAADSSNLIIANNLASLIGTHVGDPAALERAATIARRLRDREVPQFQDTYGWIEYRRGNLDEALASLEPAAAGLPEDPLVQFHLGMVYAALDRADAARTSLTLALELAGDSPLPQFDIARDTLAGLPAAGTAVDE